MNGRDPHEVGRTATSLELLYDLVFVVAIGQAANEAAHLIGEGHFAAALGGFAFAMFAVLWAWINFSWFASAFDTDDWVYRLTTMLQMVGVTILGLGLAPMFHSIDSAHGIDNDVMVAGYVVMRVGMLFQWIRAALHSPERRAACLAYVKTIVLAQIGWTATAIVHMTLVPAAISFIVLLLIELGGPYLAETRYGGTPWHAHHIAERYACLAIVVLGEGVVGTVASLSAVVEGSGWTVDAVLVAVAGMGLTFGVWWTYFLLPAGDILHMHRNRSFVWGYGSIFQFAMIAAMGAGLHVAAMFLEHHAHISAFAAVMSVAIPVGVYLAVLYLLYMRMFRDVDRFHLLLVLFTVLVLVAAPLLAAAGVSMPLCLLVVMLAPTVSVVGYELRGHRRMTDVLERSSH